MDRHHARRIALAGGLALASLGGAGACKGCGSTPAEPTPTNDGAAAPTHETSAREAGPVPVPYLPARSAPNDAPAAFSEVEAVLFRLRGPLNTCYRTANQDNPKLQGKAQFRVTISGSGEVAGVDLVREEGLDPSLIACLTGVLKKATFKPTPDGGVASVIVPLEFHPPPAGYWDAGRPDAHGPR